MAKKRLQSLEKKFESCPEVRERERERDAKSIQDNIEKGYVKKLSEEEVQCDSKVTWYLPHRFVINPKKPDRLRRAWPEICDSQRFETGARVSKKKFLLRTRSCIRLHTANYGERRKVFEQE